MLGNFTFDNPTKLHFGENALGCLDQELPKYGSNVLLAYGGGSIKRNGVYDAVMEALERNGKKVFEVAGVMPNPDITKVMEGVEIARANGCDFILAVGGGSVSDYAKAVSASIHCEEDPWEKYFLRMEAPTCKLVPLGVVLTMAGTGSEMNNGAVITNRETNQKLGSMFLTDELNPRFAILNPTYTMSLPLRQVVAGCYDIFSHVCEQYFSGEDYNVSDCIGEALMKNVIVSSRAAVANPEDYEARSNIMWAATWALNDLLKCGKSTDWMVHMIGQSVGAFTDATHGMTLSAVTLPYYRFIMDAGLHKFVRFATEVWGVDPEGKSDQQIADEGLAALEAWMRELGLAMNITELGVTEDMLDGIADGTPCLPFGYKTLTRDDVMEILKASM